MEHAEYRTMYNLETRYWWFRNIHDMLTDLLRQRLRSPQRLLDAGCGTGGLMIRLADIAPQVYGIDIASEAARYWPERGTAPRSSVASINELPFPDHHFAGVVSVDILECDGVEDRQAYSELVRVTQPGGTVIVVVPAYQWMMTKGHHEAVHAVRRYNKQTLRALASGLPIHIERVTHGFAALFPIIGGVRLVNRLQEQFGEVEVKSELQPLSPMVNNLLYGITNVERHLMRYMDMPFGSSLIMVGQKI